MNSDQPRFRQAKRVTQIVVQCCRVLFTYDFSGGGCSPCSPFQEFKLQGHSGNELILLEKETMSSAACIVNATPLEHTQLLFF